MEPLFLFFPIKVLSEYVLSLPLSSLTKAAWLLVDSCSTRPIRPAPPPPPSQYTLPITLQSFVDRNEHIKRPCIRPENSFDWRTSHDVVVTSLVISHFCKHRFSFHSLTTLLPSIPGCDNHTPICQRTYIRSMIRCDCQLASISVFGSPSTNYRTPHDRPADHCQFAYRTLAPSLHLPSPFRFSSPPPSKATSTNFARSGSCPMQHSGVFTLEPSSQ